MSTFQGHLQLFSIKVPLAFQGMKHDTDESPCTKPDFGSSIGIFWFQFDLGDHEEVVDKFTHSDGSSGTFYVD